jgi:hypothetical protein
MSPHSSRKMFARKTRVCDLAMQNYQSADRLLCGISFLSYFEPRSSAECAQLRAACLVKAEDNLKQ